MCGASLLVSSHSCYSLSSRLIGPHLPWRLCLGKGPAYLVPELFKANRGVRFAFRLQEVHGFTEHNNLRLL